MKNYSSFKMELKKELILHSNFLNLTKRKLSSVMKKQLIYCQNSLQQQLAINKIFMSNKYEFNLQIFQIVLWLQL